VEEDSMTGAPRPIALTARDDILVRGHRLAGELLGRTTFTEMFLLDMDGARPDPRRVRMVDAILVALMEHGITPSTLAARLVLDGAPEATQGAVAAGLLAVGSRFLGTVEQAAELLQQIVGDGGSVESGARSEVQRMRSVGERVPGLGHNLHGQSDPRVVVLFDIARESGLHGAHAEALDVLQRVAVDETDRQLIVNAAGAIGAILSDMGYPPSKVRGFAIVARSAGLVAHVVDEQQFPIARQVWTERHDHENPEESQ
jgi:citrate synthase